MKLMAVICEYNPFHNGHAYQLALQKERLGCDGVICLMSGSFVQRGEPALCDKWARSEMALSCGCDLVLELPVIYSLQSAEGFARGAVSILSKLGFEGYLAFGSECGDIAALERAADACLSTAYHAGIKAALAEGISYPQACCAALAALEPQMANLGNRPNDMLGIEYIKALKQLDAALVSAAIQRRGAHDATDPKEGFLSATGIRKRLAEKQDVSIYMPPSAFQILKREIAAGRGPVAVGNLDMLICYALQRAKRSELREIGGISEGLEKRLLDAAAECRSFAEIALRAKTKRYPQTRLQRAMLKILLGITKKDEQMTPNYCRILGIGPQGGKILRFLRETSTISFITKVADASLESESARRMFQLEQAATDLYSLLYPQKHAGKNGMDFYRSPVLMLSRPE